MVKGVQVGRPLVTDHVVGKLGALISAPIPEAVLVDVPKELIALEPQMKHMRPGVGHGSLLLKSVSERVNEISHTDVPENKTRFASLAVLYSLTHANDRQWLYGNEPPHLVFSVDHGHFFPGGQKWSHEKLRDASRLKLDKRFRGCGFQRGDIRGPLSRLAGITLKQLAAVVATPPREWGIGEAERIAIARFIHGRMCELERYNQCIERRMR